MAVWLSEVVTRGITAKSAWWFPHNLKEHFKGSVIMRKQDCLIILVQTTFWKFVHASSPFVNVPPRIRNAIIHNLPPQIGLKIGDWTQIFFRRNIENISILYTDLPGLIFLSEFGNDLSRLLIGRKVRETIWRLI